MATIGAAGKDPSVADDPRRAPPSAAGAALALMAGVVVGWLAILLIVLRLAALSPERAGKLLVLFPPGTAETEGSAAILAAGGAPVRPLLGGLGWIAYDETAGFVARLEANGALAAYAGCARRASAWPAVSRSARTSRTRWPAPSTPASRGRASLCGASPCSSPTRRSPAPPAS